MKIVVIASHTPSHVILRMEMMKGFILNGHTVLALGPEPEEKWNEKFLENGVQYKQFFIERNTINPISDLKTIYQLSALLKEEKPDKVFLYQAKSIVYGSFAAKKCGIKDIYILIGGLGSIFRGKGLKNNLIKIILKTEYKIAIKVSKKVFFQNNDDKDELVNNKIIDNDKAVIVNGSGVNLEKFKPEQIPETPAFLFIGRLIRDKGIMEYLEACRRIKEKYSDVECLLVGPYDSNPSAINPAEIQPYINNGVIKYFGRQNDVRPYIKQCTTYVLPSYHEGMPNTVLEAMAVGRPIITTDAPGCRETVIDGYNGFLVPVKDVDSLVEKMGILIEDVALRNSMAENSLKIAREKYDVNLVNKVIMETMCLM